MGYKIICNDIQQHIYVKRIDVGFIMLMHRIWDTRFLPDDIQ